MTWCMRPLLIAARVGRDDLVQLLVEFQAQVDGRGDEPSGSSAQEQTALHAAAACGHLAAVQVLLKFGADAALTDGVRACLKT
jgi:ankyrin repeat protein